jgi:porin
MHFQFTNLRSFFSGIIKKNLQIIICPALFIIPQVSLGQSKLADAVEFTTTVTGDFIINFQGGVKTGYTYLGKEDLNLGLDTEAAGLWKNGYFFVHGLNTHGIGPSEQFTNDLQVLCNIEAGDHTGLFEFWYTQQIGKFTVLVGQHDMNTEFLGSKYSAILVNSSFGIMPSISLNMPISIFPLAAPGFVLKYEADNNLIYRFGVYDGNPGSFDDNRYNLNVRLSKLEGFFNIGEIQFNQMDGDREVGNYKFGGYYHSGIFPDYVDTLQTIKGNYGIYALADRALFARSLHSGRGLCIFLQGGLADPRQNMVHYYLGGGFRYHGILPDRYKDQLGLGFAHISLSTDYLNNTLNRQAFETALEATYIFHFGKRYFIQPSMQYVLNPGADKSISNCLVGLLRFAITN